MIHVIHDTRLHTRRPHFERELMGLDLEVVTPVHAPTVVESINLTHKKIVRENMDKPYITIMEDDVQFVGNDGLMRFFSGTPEGEWYLYAGGSYHLERENRVGEYLIQSHIIGIHCYRIHQRFYDEFLSLPPTVHIDRALSLTHRPIHVLYPVVALQRPGFSLNNMADTDYNISLAKEDIWL